MKTEDANTIMDMAQTLLGKGHFDPKAKAALAVESPTSKDISTLIAYVSKCQCALLRNTNSNGLTIKDMKERLFSLIGYNHDRSYIGATVSRTDLLAIYTFVTALPEECFDPEKLS